MTPDEIRSHPLFDKLNDRQKRFVYALLKNGNDKVAAAHEAWAAQEQPVSRPVHFEVSAGPGAATVLADPAALHQILTNLFSNALRYTPDHGRITVSTIRSGGMVEVQVRDTGAGVPAAW